MTASAYSLTTRQLTLKQLSNFFFKDLMLFFLFLITINVALLSSMHLVTYNKYLISTVATDGLVLKAPGYQ